MRAVCSSPCQIEIDISINANQEAKRKERRTNSFEETRNLSVREESVHPFEESSVENV